MMMPQFPLQLVAFPDEIVNLHVFEPRYKQLLAECRDEGIHFGIPAYIGGKVQDTGTEMELLQIDKVFPNGEMDVSTRATGLYRIRKFFPTAPGKLYAAAEVDPFSTDNSPDPALATRVLEKVHVLFNLLEVRKNFTDDPFGFMTFEVAHHIGLTLEQEYQLLCLPSETDRLQLALDHLNSILPAVQEKEELRRKARMNGHYRNYPVI